MAATTTPAPARTTAARQALFGVNAAVAWAGVLLQFGLTAFGVYPSTNTVASQLGNPDQGALGRILDYFTYFTILSNIVVAVVLTMLALRPLRDGFWFRVFRLDSVLMIAITGIVYNAILAASARNTGWQVLANALLHIVTPILTVAVWVIAGPRGWFSWRIVGAAYILPIAWLAFALVRGAVIGAYPYPFLDVVTKGYPYVLAYAGGIIAFAFVVLMALWGLDALARRATARR